MLVRSKSKAEQIYLLMEYFPGLKRYRKTKGHQIKKATIVQQNPGKYVLFVILICYGDTIEQSTCTFSSLIHTNDIITASPYIERDDICPNDWRELSPKTCMYFVELYLRIIDGIKINKQNNHIAKGPLY